MKSLAAGRLLVGEILDRLPPDDPRAVRSRADLARINGVMRQPAVVASLLRRHLPSPPRRILEFGGGDGRFMLAVAKRLRRRWPGVELTSVDLSDCVTARTRADFAATGWTLNVVTQDVFVWAGRVSDRWDAIAVNLVLHHFEDAALRRLFATLAPLAPVFVAAEPRRAAFPLFASRLVGAIGANAVTRHDSVASVRAGFRGAELSALWPDGQGWRVEEGPRALFTHAFAASRAA